MRTLGRILLVSNLMENSSVSTSKCCGMKKYIVKVDFDSSSNVVLQYLIHESGKTHRRNRCRSLFLQSLQGSPHAFFNACLNMAIQHS
ncbi:hypothetical protein SeMB42_g07997 [Synchytrium endobioticum]|uniref:Uncharacterized protein n=1 Tax=Synchytrium endobioticum TaxID=286115 RepID=A0A507BG47_9FUNG|nr:hypothetical protein SeMB42_g07997 [Synchytrium endobioticum]